MLITGSGTPAALPERALRERGYKGKLHQTHGVANADLLLVYGKGCEGAYLPAGPTLVAEQLPGSNPVKKPALTYKTAYEETYDEQVSAFGEHMWDAGLLFAQTILGALKEGQPGTSVSRRGLRDAMGTTTNLATSHGVMSMNAKDHLGLDQRSRVMVEIKDGKWKP